MFRIRSLTPEDGPALKPLIRRCFLPPQSWFVRPTDEGLLAVEDQDPVAAVFLRVVELRSDRRMGLIAWLMTDPAYRGRGLAHQLVEAGVERLEALGCDAIVTEIEGYNHSSINTFERAGFGRITTSEQWRQYGLVGLLRLWLQAGHMVSPGHFIFLKGHNPSSERPIASRVHCWSLNALATMMAIGTGGLLTGFAGVELGGWGLVLPVLVAVCLVFGIREWAMRLATPRDCPPLVYRPWDSAVPPALSIALLFGVLFPLPGGRYPRQSARPGQSESVRPVSAALAGTLAVMLLTLAVLIAQTMPAAGSTELLYRAILTVSTPLLLFDAVFFFPPFGGFNARGLFEAHPALWAALAVPALVLFLM